MDSGPGRSPTALLPGAVLAVSFRSRTLLLIAIGVVLVWSIVIGIYLGSASASVPACCQSVVAVLSFVVLLRLTALSGALPAALVTVGTLAWVASDLMSMAAVGFFGTPSGVLAEVAGWTALLARSFWAASALTVVGTLRHVRTTRRIVETALLACTLGFVVFVMVHSTIGTGAGRVTFVLSLVLDLGYLVLAVVALSSTPPSFRPAFAVMVPAPVLLIVADVLAQAAAWQVPGWIPATIYALSHVLRVVAVFLSVRVLLRWRACPAPLAQPAPPTEALGAPRSTGAVMVIVALVLAAVLVIFPRSQWGPIATVAAFLVLVLVLAREYVIALDHRTHLGHLNQLTSQLDRQARFDDLTGLLRRDQFVAAVDDAIRHHAGTSTIALLYVDLDRFKPVNDTFGHAVGDQVLIGVAARLLAAIPGAAVGRLGGDEFGVLSVHDELTEDDVAALRNQVSAAMAEPIATESGVPVQVSVSVGTTITRTQRGAARAHTDAEELLSAADLAALRRKPDRVFGNSAARRTVLLDLEDAREPIEQLRSGRVVPWFQPIVELTSGRIIGAEALARMPGSRWGGTAGFVPLLHAAGYATALTQLMLHRSLAVFTRHRPTTENWTLTLNLSAQDISAPPTVPTMTQALRASGIDPTRVVIEVDETVVPDDATRQVIDELRTLGLRIGLDDFGALTSTFGQVVELNPSVIKLDARLNEDAGAGSRIPPTRMATAVIEVAHDIGCVVVAEGIESSGAADILARIGCDYGQGNLWSRAIPAAALLAVDPILPRWDQPG